MRYRSLMSMDGDPPSVTFREGLLPDHALMEVGGVPVYAGPAPWRGNHDLLVDEDGRTLAGIVYSVATAERAAILNMCARLPGRLVRYCVSPQLAADMLEHGTFDLDAVPRDWGEPGARVERFPEPLRPIRQLLRECFAGTRDREDVPPGLLEAAADYFKALGRADYLDEWPNGDVDRVEVVWAPKPVFPGLPSYFPSALRVELAQQFAEDIWLFRREGGEVVGVGLNHLDEILSGYGLALPAGVMGG